MIGRWAAERCEDVLPPRLMRLLERWLRFNLVGALGVGVQLVALSVFSRVLGLGDILATTLAVETSLLHNFVWHERFTWPSRFERGRLGPALRRLLGYNLTNGFISLVGNVSVVWLLDKVAPMPLLWANLAAIAACGLLNFAVSDRLVFRASHRAARAQTEPALMPSTAPRGSQPAVQIF